MPIDSNGVYSLPPGYLAVTGENILPSQHNPPLEDIAAALSQVLYRSGVAPMLGDLNMNGFTILGLGSSSEPTAPATNQQLEDAVESLQTLVANAAPTGTVSAFRRKTAPTGWIKENGGTIGNASSGATTRANADTLALFSLLWGEFDNTELPIFTSGGVASTRGANAAADFAANKRLTIHDSRTRFLRGADDGLGFDATAIVGSSQDDTVKNHVHPGATTPTTVSATGLRILNDGEASGDAIRIANGGALNLGLPAIPFTTNSQTGGSALETRPRASVALYCIKL